MWYTYSFFGIGLILSLPISSYAMQYTQTGGGISQSCIEEVTPKSKQYSFGNTYHQGPSDEIIRYGIELFLFGRCSRGANWSKLDYALIPLYYPRRGIIGFYRIYFENISDGPPSFASSTFDLRGRWFPIHGFHIGTMFHWNSANDANKQAYLKSLEPPFSTAYQVQWYVYLGNPMIVARNAEGLVTDVFIQNFRGTKYQKEVARKYLGDKWYRP